jgi:hypothetical protein
MDNKYEQQVTDELWEDNKHVKTSCNMENLSKPKPKSFLTLLNQWLPAKVSKQETKQRSHSGKHWGNWWQPTYSGKHPPLLC